MSNRLSPQAMAVGLAAVATLATLGGLEALADGQYHGAAAHYAAQYPVQYAGDNSPAVQRVEIVGHAVQQVVIVGRKRG